MILLISRRMFPKYLIVAFVIWNTSHVLWHIFVIRKAIHMSDALLVVSFIYYFIRYIWQRYQCFLFQA